ncbi:DUF262 domain-containing protein [Variovorax sp. M-6]|uniref:DUF7834 domain-containing protein n=1 Tax=Variovorax sp. M-6 TaxID=3233041 RepID=UPI003F9BCC49
MDARLREDGWPPAAATAGGIVVASTSVLALFRGDAIEADDGSAIRGRLCLPEYQRPYRWGRQQLEKLLADLRHFFEPGPQGAVPLHDFYLGSIILHQREPAALDGGALDIIDGQQRLTSMALLGCLLRIEQNLPGLQFSPESQNRIRANLAWLRAHEDQWPAVDFSRVNLTLVVTRSEDDAYRFFETQNTGGVRLDGPAIIKAHHLRATEPTHQDANARLWESMGDLNPLVDAVMKARHWQMLRWKDLASHREPRRVRDEVVAELAGSDGGDRRDMAYRPVWFASSGDGWSPEVAASGYAMRQPLNAGINTIRYLQYFHALRQELMVAQDNPALHGFYGMYNKLTVQARASVFLHKLFDSAVLLYASQFGHGRLVEASLWLFRVISSPRLSNEKMVRESTVQKFSRETMVLDRIAGSHSHEELMQYLQRFSYQVDASNLERNGVKSRFVRSVGEQLGMSPLPDEPQDMARAYDKALQAAIRRVSAAHVAGGEVPA